MMRLSSTEMRRKELPAAKRSSCTGLAAEDGTKALFGLIDSPEIGFSFPSSSKLSMAHALLSCGYWHASHSGLLIAQNLGSEVSAASVFAAAVGTAFSWPLLTVDFSACVAPSARR